MLERCSVAAGYGSGRVSDPDRLGPIISQCREFGIKWRLHRFQGVYLFRLAAHAFLPVNWSPTNLSCSLVAGDSKGFRCP